MQALKAAVYSAAGRVVSAITPKRALSQKGLQSPAKHTRLEALPEVQYECCVIGDPARNLEGNCVICQGTLLYLREKHLGVEVTKFLDESLDDPFIKQACPGEIKMPMLRPLGEERWLCGTEAIWDYVERHNREAPDLGRPVQELSDGVCLGQLAPGMCNDRLFSLLSDVLAGGDEAKSAQALKDLEGLMHQLDDWLAEREMPFIGGDAPDATDCYLAPKLNHAVLALSALRGWRLPEDLQALHRYLVLWRERPSWQQSHFDEGLALGFWRRMAKAENPKAVAAEKQAGKGPA